MWAKSKEAFQGAVFMALAFAAGAAVAAVTLAVMSAPLDLAGYQVDFSSAQAYCLYALGGLLSQGRIYMSGWRP